MKDKDIVTIEISNDQHSVYRDYALIDGKYLPAGIEERLQEMVDVINEKHD